MIFQVNKRGLAVIPTRHYASCDNALRVLFSELFFGELGKIPDQIADSGVNFEFVIEERNSLGA